MFYISLPYFYENFKFNQYLKKYIDNAYRTGQKKLITDFDIEYCYGAFPWSYWNGNINNHCGKAVLSHDIQKIFTHSYAPIRIDASNICLNEKNYLDIHENIILKHANGTNVVYEISDINLMNYISEKNLNNKFIISNNAQLLHLFNTEILNIFQEQNTIDFVNVGYDLPKDINISQIKNKNKLEISIGHCQKCNLKKQLTCIYNEQKNIYNYSGQSLFLNCPLKYTPINYYDEIQPYLKQGIKHFKIITEPKDLINFNINIIKSFIKLEYQGECIDGYYREIINSK